MIIGLCACRADLTYQQGQARMWDRNTKYDFYWPALQGLGEQEVLNREIFLNADNDHSDNDEVFGYQERWSEYRFKNSEISGILRSDAASSLDVWHAAEDFASLPGLDADFIESNPPVSRLVVVPSEPELIADMFFDCRVTRPLPSRSVPGMIDHF